MHAVYESVYEIPGIWKGMHKTCTAIQRHVWKAHSNCESAACKQHPMRVSPCFVRVCVCARFFCHRRIIAAMFSRFRVQLSTLLGMVDSFRDIAQRHCIYST